MGKTVFFTLSGITIYFLIFAGLYYWIYKSSLNSKFNYKGKTLNGFNTAEPAFLFSESYHSRIQIKAMNDLRVKKFLNQIQPTNWSSFIQLKTGKKEFDNRFEEMHEMQLRGLTSEKIIENLFPKYSRVKYLFWKNEKNYTGQQNFQNGMYHLFRSELAKHDLLSQEKIEQVYDDIMTYVNQSNSGYLITLSEFLKQTYKKYINETSNQNVFKEMLYNHVLSNLSQAITLSFEELEEKLTFMDMCYFSVVAGTTTGYGDIVPLSTIARTINWIHIILTYFGFAMLVSYYSNKVF